MTLALLLLLGCSDKTAGTTDTASDRGASDAGSADNGDGDGGGADNGGQPGTGGSDDTEGTTDPLDDDIDIPELGDPVGAPLAGTTWRVPFSGMTITEPPGLGPLIPTLIDEDALLFNVIWASADSFGLQVAIGEEGVQSPCESVQELPTVDFSENPLWEIPKTDLTLSSGSDPVTVRRAEMLGILASDGLSWTWATLRGRIDSRDFNESAEENGIDICAFLEELGGECVACDDGEEMCITLVIEEMTAEHYPAAFDPEGDDGC